jgi:hypothetical protein
MDGWGRGWGQRKERRIPGFKAVFLSHSSKNKAHLDNCRTNF